MKSAITVLAAALAISLAGCAKERDAADHRADGATPASGTPASGTTAPSTDHPSATHPADATAPGAMGTPGATAGTHRAGTGSTPDPMARNPVASSGALSLDAPDRKALEAVEAIDRHEIEAADKALSKKDIPEPVRQYAETLRQDHTRNLEEIRRMLGESPGLASEAHDGNTGVRAGGVSGTDASRPMTGGDAGATPGTARTERTSAIHRDLTSMREKFDAELKRLDELRGEHFTREWLRSMVKGHEEALAKIDKELLPEAREQPVISFLETTRASIARHLETARTLEAENSKR